ncbi:MAG: shikimate dehydrogenase [Candidatus Nanopelagicales bacterium]
MSAERRRAAVLGHPVAHSLSPVLHRAAYEALGLDWEYGLHDVTEEALPAFVRGLDSSWAGLSLTMPLKEAVVPLLDDVDLVALATGAVNTVVLDDDGRHGWNTDVQGIVAALDENGAGTGPGAVVGGGATARSAVAALARRGTTEVLLVARRPEAAAGVRATAQEVGVALEVLGWDSLLDALEADVVVSTVPAGVLDPVAGDVAAAQGTRGALLDVVYHPWPTPLAAAWSSAGGTVASGLDMLLHQAVRQVELMTGLTPPVPAMRTALQAAAAARRG